MIKYNSTLTIVIPNTMQHIALATDTIPAMEMEFKKFFSVDTEMRTKGNKSQVIVSCYITSNHMLKEIKLDSTQTHKFLDWLKKEKIYADLDPLGVKKTATIRYLLKIHNRLTNRSTLKDSLLDELNLVVIDLELAVELDPLLKEKQTEAMSNGDMFVPESPPFKIYQTEIGYGRDKTCVKKVLDIKCALDQVWLLKEFFSQIANPMVLEKRIGMFLPTSAVHIIGQAAYTNLLCTNNEFLQSILVTVPLGDFQHATLEIPFSDDPNTDIEQTTLYEKMLEQDWCINVKLSMTPNKILIITTKSQVQNARKWADETLPALYNQHISDKLDVTPLQQMTP